METPADGYIEGYTDVLIQAQEDNVGTLNLELFAPLVVDSVWQAPQTRNKRTFTHTSPALAISLAPLQDGEQDTIRVFYKGNPRQDPQGFGGYYFGSTYAFAIGLSGSGELAGRTSFGSCWFPCVDNFTDKARFDFKVTCATTYSIYCNGTRQGSPVVNGGLHTYHWRLGDPIPVYLANFALGPFSGTSTSYTSQNGPLPVNIVAADNAPSISGTMANLPQALAIYENRFGPYQWERLGYVFTHLPGFALENATNILMPLITLTGDLLFESVVVHELAHSWFGNLVTCVQPSEMWFNEGAARWAEGLYFEDKYTLQTGVNHLRTAHQKALNISDQEEGDFYPLSNVPSNHIYGTTSYEKGATVMQTLRHYMGDDAFFPALQALFQSSYQFDNISSNQFADFLGTHSGQNLTSFFEGWVHSPGWVAFAIDSVVTTPQGSNFQVRLHLRQTRYYKPDFIDDNRLEVAFYRANRTRVLDTLTFSGETGTYTTTLSFEPVMVVLDPDDKCLDASFDNLVQINGNGTTTFSFSGASMQVTNYLNNSLVYLAHRYGKPTGLLDYDTLVLADNYYEFKQTNPGNFTYRLNFDFRGNTSVDAKDRRWFSNVAEANIRLVYRPHAGANWEPVANVTRSTGGASDLRGTLSVANNPPAGQYAFAVRVAGVSRQQARLQNDWMQLGPVPAMHTLTVQWIQPQLASLQVLDMQGRVVKAPQPVQGQQAQLAVETLPTGVYLLQALDKRGKAVSVKRFVVQH